MSGSILYAGGAFTIVDGKFRGRLAAFDANGDLTDWDPEIGKPIADSSVSALAATNDTVYVGGDFSLVGSASLRIVLVAAIDVAELRGMDFERRRPRACVGVFGHYPLRGRLFSAREWTVSRAWHIVNGTLLMESGRQRCSTRARNVGRQHLCGWIFLND